MSIDFDKTMQQGDREADRNLIYAVAKGCSDHDNALRFAAVHRRNYLFIPELGWMHWIGTHFELDTLGQVEIDLIDSVTDSYAKDEKKAWTLVATEQDDEHKKRLIKAALKLRSEAEKLRDDSGVKGALSRARRLDQFKCKPEDLDADPMLINTPAGVINAETREISRCDPEYKMTRSTAVGYDPNADAPKFKKALHEWLPHEDERRHVQQVLGQGLVGRRDDGMSVWLGSGANGKSALLDSAGHVAGSYYHAARSDLLTKDHSSLSTEDALAEFHRMRLVSFSEVAHGTTLGDGLLKVMTDRKFKARRKHKSQIEVVNEAQYVLLTNHLHEVEGVDHGTFRRLRVLRFKYRIPKAQQDTLWVEKTIMSNPDEAAGVLRWMVEGLFDVLENGFFEPESVIAETAKWEEESDIIGTWISQYLEITGNHDDMLWTDSAFKQSFLPFKSANKVGGERVTISEWRNKLLAAGGSRVATDRPHIDGKRVSVLRGAKFIDGVEPDSDPDQPKI